MWNVNKPFCDSFYIVFHIWSEQAFKLNWPFCLNCRPMGQTIRVSNTYWKLVYHRGTFENSVHRWGLVDSLLHINMEHNWHLVRSFLVCCEKEQLVYIKHEPCGDPICTPKSGNNSCWHRCQNYIFLALMYWSYPGFTEALSNQKNIFSKVDNTQKSYIKISVTQQLAQSCCGRTVTRIFMCTI